jgi:hypothetical protein
MAKKSDPKPKLTDAERRKRFVDMAKEVGASENRKILMRPSRRSRKNNLTEEMGHDEERGSNMAGTRNLDCPSYAAVSLPDD